MMKRTPILAKYCGRAFSTVRSSSLASNIKRRWGEQKGLGLWFAFFGGYFGHGFWNLYKRREHWYKVERMLENSQKREKELTAKTLQLCDILSQRHREIMERTSRSSP